MGNELFSAGSIDDLIGCRTNAPLALRDGWVTEEVLSVVLEELESRNDISNLKGDVLRINEDGLIFYALTRLNMFYSEGIHYRFSPNGELLERRTGRSFWIYTPIKRWEEINGLIEVIKDKNLEDLKNAASQVEVYADDTLEVERITQQKAETLEQINGRKKMELQIKAYLQGANAITSYAALRHETGIPVILR